jgi:hypothetical protein
MRLAMVLNRDELNDLGYPVVVEMWEKAVGNSASGSKRRKYQAEFTESERIKARNYRNLFHVWYLVKGTPDEYVIRPNELEFVIRLISFFGTL